MQPAISSPKPLRLLIIRIGAMGDVLHALPAIEALRQKLPMCFIGWAIEPHWRPLLWESELINQVHEVPTKEWKRRPFSRQTVREIAVLRQEIKAMRYDVSVDLQGSIRSAVIGSFAAARFLGPKIPREPLARCFYREPVPLPQTHVIDQACALVAAAVGTELAPVAIHLPHYPQAVEDFQYRFPPRDPMRETFAVLIPTAGWGAKQWPVQYFQSLARLLRQHGLRVVINAPTSDDPVALQLAGDGLAEIYQCDLSGLTELLRRASLVVGGDTGPVHLAAALGRPVLALFGPTDPARTGPQAFIGSHVRVLRSPASVTSHQRLQETEAGLVSITVQSAWDAASQLLRATR